MPLDEIKLIVYLVGFAAYGAAAATAGWKVNGWAHDAAQLQAEKAQQAIVDAAAKRESTIAAELEEKLQKFKAEQRTISHETIKIVDRPVYSNQCLDADGVRLANAAAGIQAPATAAKPASEVPTVKPFDGHDWNGRAPSSAIVGRTVP